jgi:hypothetical protein
VIETHSKAGEFRQTAARLREIATGMEAGDARTEIVELAERFERLAEHSERKATDDPIVGRALPAPRLVTG